MKDPVCGMDVQDDKFTLDFDGRKFYFCSLGDLEKFKADPNAFADKYEYDLVIVGAGPAGLTAAVYASILKLSTLLISEDIGGQPITSSKIVNYMGFDFISGQELVQKFQNQLLQNHYIDHRIDTVNSIEKIDSAFVVKSALGKRYKSSSVIVATGSRRGALNVPGEKEFVSRGVSYALTQDLSIFAGKSIAVVGGGNTALQSVLDLAKNKCRVTVVSRRDWKGDPSLVEEVRKLPDLVVLKSHNVVEIRGSRNVESVVVRDLVSGEESIRAVDGVLVAIGFSPSSSIVERLVDLNENREIKVTRDCETRTPGLLACGDVTDTTDKRIIIASGEGAKAALSARRYLLTRKRKGT